jgi:hypothetical protein
MNCKKISVLALALVGALLLPSVASAVPPRVFLGAGSSAQFPTAGIAAVSPDPVTAVAGPCGTFLWTGKNGSAGATVLGIDPRASAPPNPNPPYEPGNIWVAWDVEPNPTVVCAYLVVDSIVGLRLFYGQGGGGDWLNAVPAGQHGNGTLHFTSGNACGNLIAGFPDNSPAFVGPPATPACTVPADVVAAINSAGAAAPIGFNVAMTDVRPEDGQYANGRASVAAPNGFGYNPGAAVCGPNPVLSAFTATNAQVCQFAVSGTDPISGFAVPATGTYGFGAAPIVIFGNNNATMGTAPCVYPTNILSKTVSKLWSGQIGTANQAFGPGVCNAQLSVVQREPVSGTYNTFEFQIVHARDGNSGDTQEINNILNTPIVGNPPAGNCPVPPVAFTLPYTCTNPVVLSSGQNSVRLRAIGTGEMIKAVNGGTGVAVPPYPDKLGYAFYSLGSFFSAANARVQYLKLQGVDGLYGNYDTSGLFGTCAGTIPGNNFQCTTKLPSFAHLIDGSYRVWSNYRWVAPPNLPAGDIRMQVLNAGLDQAHYAIANPALGGISCSACNIKAVADFVPPQDFPVFRSHYPLGSVAANNGTNPPNTFCAADQVSPNCFEEGGDMAGVAYFKITDVQLFNATGAEFLTNIE